MRKLSAKSLLLSVLFTVLGMFSVVVLSDRTDLHFGSLSAFFFVALGAVLLHNFIGFSLFFSGDRLLAYYPIFRLKPQRLWWYYGLLAFVLLVGDYVTMVGIRCVNNVASPFVVNFDLATIVVYVWFVEMMIMSLLMFVKSIRYTVSILKDKRRLETEVAEAKYNALQQQLNPHFLFNSLNTLIAEIEYNPSEAVAFTQHLSDVYRYVLRSQGERLVTVREELEFVESFVFLHKVRLGDCLNLNVRLSEDELEYKMPPLTLQLLVENVIKHNNISLLHPMNVELYCDKKKEMLVFVNDLCPKKSMVESGRGLQNLSDRYRLLGCKGVEVSKNETTFSVFVPLLLNESKFL